MLKWEKRICSVISYVIKKYNCDILFQFRYQPLNFSSSFQKSKMWNIWKNLTFTLQVCLCFLCRRVAAFWLASAEGSFGPGVVPSGFLSRCGVGVGAVGSRRVRCGIVSLSGRSLAQFSRGDAGCAAAVARIWREESHRAETCWESAGGRRPSVCPAGRPAVMEDTSELTQAAAKVFVSASINTRVHTGGLCAGLWAVIMSSHSDTLFSKCSFLPHHHLHHICHRKTIIERRRRHGDVVGSWISSFSRQEVCICLSCWSLRGSTEEEMFLFLSDPLNRVNVWLTAAVALKYLKRKQNLLRRVFLMKLKYVLMLWQKTNNRFIKSLLMKESPFNEDADCSFKRSLTFFPGIQQHVRGTGPTSSLCLEVVEPVAA